MPKLVFAVYPLPVYLQISEEIDNTAFWKNFVLRI